MALGIAYYPWPEPGVEVDKIVLKFQRFDVQPQVRFVKASWELKSGSNGKHSGSLNVADLSWDPSDPASLVSAYNEAIRLLAENVDASL